MAATVSEACKHCRERTGTRGRGLCGVCFYLPGVRERFPLNRITRTAYGRFCRHCKDRPVSKPRGLCYRCYFTPGVKEQFPPVGRTACRGVGNLTGNRPLPVEACPHPPGTPEKLAVLAGRAERGEQLFHPADHTGGA